MIDRGTLSEIPDTLNRARFSQRGNPTWEVAYCFPRQGEWTAAEFLALETANFPVELIDGCLEFLPMPTYSHQRLVRFLFLRLNEAAEATGKGQASFALCPIRLCEGRFREPDVFFLGSERVDRHEDPPTGAEIVIEVLSPGQRHPERDLVEKRADYAKAQIPEYWIVDPEHLSVTVLSLMGPDYTVSGEYANGQTAVSAFLPEFQVDVNELFASARRQ